MCEDNHKEPFYKKPNQDEKNLWLRETLDIKKLKQTNVIATPTKSNSRKSTSKTGRHPEESTIESSTQKVPVNIKGATGLRKSNKKKRMTGRIDLTIDLHGLNQEQAYDAILKTLVYAYNNNRIFILIITGKGKPSLKNLQSPPSGILREKVPKWLESKPLSDFVFKVEQADKRHGGTGALYVQLRKKDKNATR